MSVGVPGTISGIFDAHKKFGNLSIEQLFNPAINLAEKGFVIDKRQASLLNKHNQLHAVPNVYVTDGSAMASSGSQNPSLTYMALTARAANHAVKELKKMNL